MPPRNRNSVALSYTEFKKYARGWDAIPHADEDGPALSLAGFRERIFPLRRKREWSEAEMEAVLELEAYGLGPALRKFFGGHAEAAKLELRAEHEPFSRSELDAALDDMLAAARREKWDERLYIHYVEYLDQKRTFKADAEEGPDDHLFRDAYQKASREVKAYVRKRLLDARPQ